MIVIIIIYVRWNEVNDEDNVINIYLLYVIIYICIVYICTILYIYFFIY